MCIRDRATFLCITIVDAGLFCGGTRRGIVEPVVVERFTDGEVPRPDVETDNVETDVVKSCRVISSARVMAYFAKWLFKDFAMQSAKCLCVIKSSPEQYLKDNGCKFSR